jgi:hypothetical protein
MDNDGHQPENVPGKFCPCGLQIFRSSPLVHDPARQIWWWWPSTDPDSVRDQSQRLAQRWSEPHRWHREDES